MVQATQNKKRNSLAVTRYEKKCVGKLGYTVNETNM